MYEQLEKEYAEFTGHKYCVSVNSGTSALHLALIACGVREGDEVIVPDFTMGACGFAVSYVGAKVVTVDCGDDLNIDVTQIEKKITDKTKAIMAVHIYGRLCDMEEINRIAKKYHLKVIEDACEAQGAKVGNADVTCFSFYKNKIIHAEEGGALCTNSQEIYDNVKDLKNMAFGSEHNYFHTRIGYNYRMPDSQAKMALESLREYPKNAEKRRTIEALYEKHSGRPSNNHDAVWVYDFLCEKPNELTKKCKMARQFFKPLSTMPMWKQETGANAEYYSKYGAYFIVDPNLTQEEIISICSNLK